MSYLILQGDARAIPLPDNYVQTVITSPPYWGLRDYGQAGQIGLEPTPEDYVQALVAVFDEVWRVLRGDGTAWLNLGDSYAAGGQNSGSRPEDLTEKQRSNAGCRYERRVAPAGLKPKDLVGIPWRVAFALQARGWYLRSDIIWAKPNPMPESVTDRPTRSHEYLFLLTKSERYTYDAEAVRETSVREATTGKGSGQKTRKLAGHTEGHRVNDHLGSSVPWEPTGRGRNRRSVWTITPKPYRGAHFATFPPDLVEPCLLAGAPPQVCTACGRAYARVIEKGDPLLAQQQACGGDAEGSYAGEAVKDYASAGAQDPSAVKARILAGMVERTTVGWVPQCTCDAGYAPPVVLDPFGGSGTVAQVAHQHGRVGVVIDSKLDYCRLAQQRLAGV